MNDALWGLQKKPENLLLDTTSKGFLNYFQMQIDIEGGKFIEHGEYRGNLYGTSTDGVRDLIGTGLQPIISPHYQVGGSDCVHCM